MASCSRESPVSPSPALYPVSAGGCTSNLHGCAWRLIEFYESWNGFPFRCPQGADASNNTRLLPSERGSPMPNREPDPLHSALQQGWEAIWGGPVLQVRRATELSITNQDFPHSVKENTMLIQ